MPAANANATMPGTPRMILGMKPETNRCTIGVSPVCSCLLDASFLKKVHC
jgi:hypothetical protein